MIFISKNKENYKIKQILYQVAKTFHFPISVIFNNETEDASLKFDNNKKQYFIEIGVNFNREPLCNFDFDTKVTCKIIEIFHEYKHYLQYTQITTPEIKASIDIGNIYPIYKNLKYCMLPQELDAEIYGIQNAHIYIKEKLSNIDFDKCFLTYVNNIPQWYGIYPLKHKRPIFDSVEEALGYLYYYKEISYDYPIPIEYNGFDNKAESIRVANLSSGAEQFFLITKDLYTKGKVNKELYQLTLDLMNKYKVKQESVNDIQLNIEKEPNKRDISLLLTKDTKIDNKKEKEDIE